MVPRDSRWRVEGRQRHGQLHQSNRGRRHHSTGELDLPAPVGVAPPITSDPPFHAIARRLILPAFAPGPINALEPMIRELCSSLLDEVKGEEIFNASSMYARFIPPGVIRGMLGFPEGDTEKFFDFVHIILEGIDHPEEERLEEFMPVEEYFTAQIQDHMDNPRDDLTSYLLNVELDGQNWLSNTSSARCSLFSLPVSTPRGRPLAQHFGIWPVTPRTSSVW